MSPAVIFKLFSFPLPLSQYTTIWVPLGTTNTNAYLQNTPVSVAARSKAWVCGRSPTEIMGLNPTAGMDICLLWVLCVLSGRGLCDEPITRPEESYRLWCVVVSDLDTSWMRRPWPNGGCCAKKQTNKETSRIRVFECLACWSLQTCQPAKQKLCVNLKFHSCYFSNLSRLDLRGDSAFILEQWNSILVYTL